MDRISKEQRSQLMSKIRSKDTTPELQIRRHLFAGGWRFRVCDKRLPGRPDVVIPRARSIIDIRGCFWHRHGCSVSTMPKSNIPFWMEKWSKNVRRDMRNEKAWREAGWNTIIVWECALSKALAERTLGRIEAKLAEWAAEAERGEHRKVPHRLQLPAVAKAAMKAARREAEKPMAAKTVLYPRQEAEALAAAENAPDWRYGR